jgi:arylsulfatase A-like enzyme
MSKVRAIMIKSRKIFTWFAVVALASAISCSCRKSPPQLKQPRLVILYATCSVNKDYLSPYNAAVSFTPNIKTFAKASMVFTKHITEAGQSGPAYASIFTGTQVDKHGVYRHPTILSDDLYLISEAYNDSGYETFFWNAHQMASAGLNYGQGVKGENTFDHILFGDEADFLKILKKLKFEKNYKAFLLVNFTVTHLPYDASKLEGFIQQYPAEAEGITHEDIVRYETVYRENYLELEHNFPETIERLNLSRQDVIKLSKVVELLYKKNVRLLDYLFGKVVEQVEKYGLLDESLIVFTADHGEILYRENALFKWTHGEQLTPEVLNVPLIIYCPYQKAKPGYYNKVTRSIDLFPTMIGLSGLSLPSGSGIDGADLSNAVLGIEPAADLLAYSHTCVLNQYVLQQIKDWTLIHNILPRVDVNLIWVSIREDDTEYKLKSLDATNWGIEVFDLDKDPGERVNLYDPNNRKVKEMEEKLYAYKRKLVNSYHFYKHDKSKEMKRRVSKEKEIEALKSLGYIK